MPDPAIGMPAFENAEALRSDGTLKPNVFERKNAKAQKNNLISEE